MEAATHDNTCDCGAPFQPRAGYPRACSRCVWLDGRGPLEQDIILALREVQRATPSWLARELGKSQRSIGNSLRRLVDRGRVRRVEGVEVGGGGWHDSYISSVYSLRST